MERILGLVRLDFSPVSRAVFRLLALASSSVAGVFVVVQQQQQHIVT